MTVATAVGGDQLEPPATGCRCCGDRTVQASLLITERARLEYIRAQYAAAGWSSETNGPQQLPATERLEGIDGGAEPPHHI